MTVLKAKIGGQWVPIGGDSDYARWNSAWGVQARVGRSPGGNDPMAVPGGAVNFKVSDTIPFTMLTGRRYRLSWFMRAWAAAAPNLEIVGYFSVRNDGAAIVLDNLGDTWFNDTTYNSNNHTYMEWIVNGDGVARNYVVCFNSGTGNAWHLYGAGTNFTIEDIGPVSGSVPVPNPTPAWATATLPAGWTHEAGFTPVRSRKIGDIVYIEGTCNTPAGFNSGSFYGFSGLAGGPKVQARIAGFAFVTGVGGSYVWRGDWQPNGTLQIGDFRPVATTPPLPQQLTVTLALQASVS